MDTARARDLLLLVANQAYDQAKGHAGTDLSFEDTDIYKLINKEAVEFLSSEEKKKDNKMDSKTYDEESSRLKLEAMFDNDFGLDTKGTAFIHVAVIGPDGTRYGSYKRIDRSWLIGRSIKYEWVDYAPGILVLDSKFNPVSCEWSNPLERK